jgi:hypothetical protein
LIEGKRPERYRAEHTVRLPDAKHAPAHDDSAASESAVLVSTSEVS